MTTPTGAIGLAAVQAEFGGTNPISLGEYYRGGSLVNAATAAGTSGAQIATSGAIRLGDFRGVVAAFVRNPLILPAVSQSSFSSPSNTVWINFYTDGTVQGFGTPNVALWAQNWRVPTEAGIGSSYYIKATLASGSAPNGVGDPALGAWHQLNAVRGWAYITSGGAASSRSGTLNIYISTSASDAGIVGSGTVYLYSERES